MDDDYDANDADDDDYADADVVLKASRRVVQGLQWVEV